MAPRTTIQNKCILLAAADGRIDERKMRDRAVNLYKKHCEIGKTGQFKFTPPYSLNAMIQMIRHDTTAEEIAEVVLDNTLNVGKLYRLADRRGLKIKTAEDSQ